MAANVLASKGVVAESLNGGITELPDGKTQPLSKLIKAATE